MAYKKKLYGTRLDKIQEEIDNQVQVVEVDGKKVSNTPTVNTSKYINLAPIKETAKSSTKTSTKKSSKKDLGDNIGFVGKSLSTGILGGFTGIFNAAATDLADNLEKGKADRTNVGKIASKILAPGLDSIIDTNKKVIDVWKNDDASLLEKIVDTTTASVSGLVDLGMTPVNTIAQSIGALSPDNTSKKVLEMNDTISEPYKYAQTELANESQLYGGVTQKLGEVAGVVGNMVPGIAAGAINPAAGLATMGTSAKGLSTQEALDKGVALEEAVDIGNTKGMIEVGTELLTGGVNFFGKGALDDIIEKGIDKKVKNEVANYFAQKGAGLLGESAEETISDVLNTVIDKGTVDPDASYSLEDFGDTAVTTMLSTAVINLLTGGYGGSSYKSNTTRINNNTNKDAVIDKELTNRLSVFEQDGKTLTNKEISKIKKEIETDFEKGAISTDTIESALGGDTYNQLQSIRKQKSALEQEIQELENKPLSQITVKENERLQAIREELGTIDTSNLETQLKSEMEQKIANDSNLQKSYIEKEKRKESFTYDNEITDAKEKAVYESAAKYFNNTTRSHEFVERVAKISKDKGTNYGFINNEELQTLGHDVEGKQVNGLVRTNNNGEQTVLINVDSPKALETIVGHETTHLLEGTQEYNDLQEAIFNYAKEKGDFDARQETLNSLYKGIENANVDSELTADLVGDYLFTDTDFINSLSTQKPTVFQRIKELIDDLVVRFTGTKEGKALREVQKKFKEAYKQKVTSQETTKNTQYSIAGVKAMENANAKSLTNLYNKAVEMSKEGASNEEIRRKTRWYQDKNGDWKFEVSDEDFTLKRKLRKNGKYKLGDIVNHDVLFMLYPELENINVSFEDMKSSGEYNASKNRIRVNNNNKTIRRTLIHEIQHAIQHIEGYEHGTTSLFNKSNYANNLGEIEATDAARRMKMDYKERLAIAPESSKTNPIHPNKEKILNSRGTIEKMRDGVLEFFNDDVKYSLTDNQGRTLSKEQQEYFKDSKVRDDNGNLVTVYHGTNKAGFTEFNRNVNFFTDSKEVAQTYTGNDGIYEGYINITNPVTINANNEIWSKIDIDSITIDGIDDVRDFLNTYGASTWEEEGKLRTSTADLVSAIEEAVDEESIEADGVIIKNIYDEGMFGDGTVGNKLGTDYITFNKNQFKNSDNTNPTDNPDIRYSLSESNANLKEQQLDIILKENPMIDDYHTGIRTVDDIKTFDEVIDDDESFVWGDFTQEDAKQALEKGTVTVYSSKPITNGSFVSTSQNQARDYAGNGKIYSQEVSLEDVAWINGDEGQYAKVSDTEYSLSQQNKTPTKNPNLTYGEDIKLQVEEAIAPLKEQINELTEQLANNTTDNVKVPENPNMEQMAPIPQDIVEKQNQEAFNNIDDSNMPGEVEDTTPDTSDKAEMTASKSLFETRNYEDVGDRKVNAYQYDNPEVKPYFQETALAMLGDLKNSIKGVRIYNDEAYYNSNGEIGFYGVTRQTTDDIAELLDGMNGKFKYTYADIEKGLNAIINDEGAENNAISKRIEMYLDQRLRQGYTTVDGFEVPANQEYIDMMDTKTTTGEDIADYHNSIPITDDLAPVENVNNVSNSKSVAPVKETVQKTAIEPKMKKASKEPTYNEIAEVMVEEPKTESQRNKRKWAIFKANVLDKGIVFEDLSLKENNRELIGKWDYTLTSEARGQYAIGNGHNGLSKSLNDIRAEVENTGLTKDFYNYMYHKHNVDRMSLASRFEGMENKPVFGDSVTAEQSQVIVNQYEKNHPEFMDFAQDVYDYVNADRQLLVDKGVISQETADLWSEMYPHYVPTRRTTDKGLDINVPLDTGRTGINAPIKRATGGNANILPLFDTMAMRTLQTYRATAKNSFGVELMNTLGTKLDSNQANVDEIIDSIETQEDLLQEGKNGRNPTFTVFENGEKATFEITKDMYDALQPLSESSLLSKTIKPLNIAGNIRRGLLTEYNPVFMLTNAIKDTQDVLINSQHVAKTYSKIPEAHKQLFTKGYWYQEYIANGGEQNSYFDNETNTFKTENKGLSKILDMPPLSTISKINNYIEMIPRLSEYIASRESGRSIEVSMLDAARVTTNFKAGGAVTKWANRNGATFLNASIQGAMQQVRNVREAKANGLRGWVGLATKFAIAGLPTVLLNGLVWEDDEDYEELSDYVKQNYYVVGKDDNGNFIRIPKGRTVAVIQEAINQMGNLITGNDEVDFKTFIDLAINNLAPNNPLDNNIFSPIAQTLANKTWYGGDLVPTRLQNMPKAEQYDESTDMFSRWVGETFNVSPYKVNYLLDQYSGGVGDVLLPMMTPEAESDGDSIGDYLLAPLRDKFSTNSTTNNQNVSDFYDLKEELTVNANMSNATDEDVLKNKYINSINSELSKLYAEKREVQNSNLSNSEKYKKVMDIQSQINELSENALSEHNNVKTTSNYSKIGDKEYYKRINSEGEEEWTKVNDEEAKDLKGLGLSISEKNTYFKTKNEISDITKEYKNDKGDLSLDDKEAIEKLSDDKKADIIDKIKNTGLNDKQKAYLYGKYYSSDETLEKVTSSGISFDNYLNYEKDSLSLESTEEKVEYLYNSKMTDDAKTVIYETSILTGFDNEDKYKDYKMAKASGVDIDSWLSYKKQEFVADKDSSGKSISGSRKDKIISYINSLDLSIPQKAILIRQEYTSFDDYNNQIVEYVSGLNISYEEKVKIIKGLDMTIGSDGRVYWD